MAYFHCNELDKIISIDEIRSEFEGFQVEGYYIGYTFEEYLNGCMSWNNGELTPIADYINGLKRDLRRVLQNVEGKSGAVYEWYADEIEDLNELIAECQKYLEV